MNERWVLEQVLTVTESRCALMTLWLQRVSTAWLAAPFALMVSVWAWAYVAGALTGFRVLLERRQRTYERDVRVVRQLLAEQSAT